MNQLEHFKELILNSTSKKEMLRHITFQCNQIKMFIYHASYNDFITYPEHFILHEIYNCWFDLIIDHNDITRIKQQLDIGIDDILLNKVRIKERKEKIKNIKIYYDI